MSRNLLVIMSDEHQARALGVAGHFAHTPNLDRLAARGVRFTNAYTPSPICVPARASFATGLYPHQTRLWDNAMPYAGQMRGWGHMLQDAGVQVESIGKLHYRAEGDPAGFDAEHLPMMVKDGVGMVWASMRKPDERVRMQGRMLGEIGRGESTYTRYDQAVTDRAVGWLGGEAADEPFCLYVGLVAPHFPLMAPGPFYDLYDPDKLPEPKLRPSDGYRRHPWVEAQSWLDQSETKMRDEAERKAAVAAYFGLVSWMDHNVGRILDALEVAGLSEETTVVYTSDHGDNVGARGLWGKSNFYEESAAVPLILSRPGGPVGVEHTPVSLIDLSNTIPDHFGLGAIDGSPGRSLYDIMASPEPDREVFSEYHAAGAVSGGFMLRRGRWKLNHYVGFPPELFDLDDDPEEMTDRAADPACAAVLADMTARLRRICDPDVVDAQAHADQTAMIERYGGREAALNMGAQGATPPPST